MVKNTDSTSQVLFENWIQYKSYYVTLILSEIVRTFPVEIAELNIAESWLIAEIICVRWWLKYSKYYFFAHWQVFIVNKQTDIWSYNLCYASMSESSQFDNLLF